MRELHGRNLTTVQRRAVERLRDVVSLKNADFGMTGSLEGSSLPKTEAEVTAFIKGRTRLYFQSWALPIIDGLLSDGR